jgi:hypothetical protein
MATLERGEQAREYPAYAAMRPRLSLNWRFGALVRSRKKKKSEDLKRSKVSSAR